MNESLDPADWTDLRALGHRMMDDMFDHLAGLRDRPLWQPPPDSPELSRALPRGPTDPAEVYDDFRRLVLPYSVGNLHPGFMGWVHGGGTAVGMLAELLAGGLNANLGGRNHAPLAVEQQVIAWSAEMVGFPADASGLLVTGTSIANLIGVLVARRAALGPEVRSAGLGGARLVAYTSAGAHGCVPRAMDMAGLGTDALRLVPADAGGRMNLEALEEAIRQDRAAGAHPFLVVGTAGTVNTGAVDDLAGLAAICRREEIWFHVDGAFGALAMLSATQRPLLRGIEQADSLAFDFHKWAQVPYDAGCVLVRDPARHLDTFAQDSAYLRRDKRGLAAGYVWPCDLGPDLSRGFRALKVWMTLASFGADQLGAVVDRSCALAQRLAAWVAAEPGLELMAPVALNIVCFRVRGLDDAGNAAIVADLHEAGHFAPSTTWLGGRLAIRAALVNHRTQAADVNNFVIETMALANQAAAQTSYTGDHFNRTVSPSAAPLPMSHR
jgi:glutamate/tyrosine decarboxylase-like PLP-dependent enzyme